MTAAVEKTAVPVDLLRIGLYVSALDRPWIETPFLFQGFRIVGREELRALQKHCRYVYVDLERSDSAAARAMTDVLQQTAAEAPDQEGSGAGKIPNRPSDEAVKASSGVLFDDTPHPDFGRFTVLLQDAHVTRHEARRVVEDNFRRAVRGDQLDRGAVRECAQDMVNMVLRDPSAALWLTHLRDRDTYLATHSVNTCVLAVTLGAHLGIKGNALTQLGTGALLHAIGKLCVPADLLNRRGPLSDVEMDVVRRYPQAGYRMAAACPGIPQPALEVIRFHQERWSGQGYPEGLIGDSIPRSAQIVGLVHSYDAMTRGRPYRAAMTPDDALHALYRRADREFSGELVQAFICRIGTFPVGTVVELDNGAIGVVVGTRPGAGLRPTVLMQRNPQGDLYEEPLLVNLAVRGQSEYGLGDRHIRRAISADRAGIDISALIREETRVAA